MDNATGTIKPISLDPIPDTPLVSILVANFNYERYIGEAIESVLVQGYPHWELIVCDDGSTDDSRNVVNKYKEREPRIRLIYQENGGQASALNTAFEDSKGNIIAILDSDDIFLPTKLEEIVTAFQTNPSCGLVTHQVMFTSKIGKSLLPTSFPSRLDSGWLHDQLIANGGVGRIPPASGFSLKKEVANAIFPIPEVFRSVADGYLARCAALITETGGLHKTLALYRLHGSNITGNLTPSLSSATKDMSNARLMVHQQNAFVKRVFGYENPLKLEDMPGYWDGLLALWVLGGKLHLISEYTDLSPKAIIEKVRNPKRRAVWSLLLQIPSPLLRKTMLNMWYGYNPLKWFIKRFGVNLRE